MYYGNNVNIRNDNMCINFKQRRGWCKEIKLMRVELMMFKLFGI